MNTIGIIDYAVMMTRSKGGAFANIANIKSIIEKYYSYGDSMGFTSLGNARSYICTLSQNDIKKELLKNIVKSIAVDKKYNRATVLSTTKSIGDELTKSQLEFLLMNRIEFYPIEVIEEIFAIYPEYLYMTIDIFVEKRYFGDEYGYGIANLDDKSTISPYYQKLLDKIDKYYTKVDEDTNIRGII